MFIKVRKTTFKFYENLSPKLRDYNMRTRSWFPALATTTNQHFGMHFKLVRVPASSLCLPPLLGPRFLLAPMWEFDFDLGLRKRVPFIHATWQPYLQYSLCLWYNFLEVFNLYFTCNLMWYICVIPYPTKRKVMSSSHPMFLLLLCQSNVEFFYGFLGMFHIRFVHARCLYRMISCPLDQNNKVDNISSYKGILGERIGFGWYLAPFVALIWTSPPLQILVHYERGRMGALSCALD
jgi:hypothetical protein